MEFKEVNTRNYNFTFELTDLEAFMKDGGNSNTRNFGLHKERAFYLLAQMILYQRDIVKKLISDDKLKVGDDSQKLCKFFKSKK